MHILGNNSLKKAPKGLKVSLRGFIWAPYGNSFSYFLQKVRG
jgi:hypothetical protein